MNVKEYFIILLIVFFFVLAFILGGVSLIYPWIFVSANILNKLEFPTTFFKYINLDKHLLEKVSNFFNHKIIYTQKIEKYNFNNKQYIKCLMPHGLIPFNWFCIMKHYNNKDIPVLSNILFDIPIFSHIVKMYNSVPAEYNKMDNVLSKNKSIIVYPGGVQETFKTSHKKEILVINKRKGIFHLSLKNGIPLLPMYTFGISELYQKSNFKIPLEKILEKDYDLSWYYGKYNTLFPYKKRLLTIIGNPIYVSKRNNITDDDISYLRNKYIIVIKSLFNKWKSEYCERWKNKELVII